MISGAQTATVRYELIAIGSGPAGVHAAVEAAQLGKRSAVVERQSVLGEVCTNAATDHSRRYGRQRPSWFEWQKVGMTARTVSRI